MQSIAERLAVADADTLSRQAITFRNQRRDILDRLCRLRQKLLTARTDEYREVVIDGEGIPPSIAARQVAEGTGKNDWIPAPVKTATPLPLSATEIIELYKTNNIVTADDESELSAMLPALADLLTPEDFEKLISEKEQLKTKDLKYRKELWAEGHPTSRTALRDLLARLHDAVSSLDAQRSWQIRLIEIGKQGCVHREPWDSILGIAEKLYEDAARAQAVIFEHGPTLVTELSLEEQETILGELVEFTSAGKRIGWMTLLFHSRWKRVVRSAKVAGQPPESVDHYSALKTAASIQINRKRFVERWQRMMQSVGASELAQFGETPEQDCVRYIPLIKNHLDWTVRVWSPLEEELKKVGFRWDALQREVDPISAGQSEPLRIKQAIDSKLPAIFEARIDLISWSWVQDSLKKQQRVMEACVGKDHTAIVVRNLIQAVKDGDIQRYRDSYQRLNDLIHRRDALNLRNELLKRLEPAAPTWAAAIRNRSAPHNFTEPPGDGVQAWRWRQIHDELIERSKITLEEIQKQLEDLGENSQRTTVELIDRLTWAAQVRRTSVAQRQALIGYSLTKRKIGKGTGKRERVLRLQSEARRLLGECRSAVPVWIMPLSRVVESFIPNRDRFDVVIIDEASQSDVMAMVALYFAKEVVIVGDHEQVSPDAVGQNQDEVTNLIDAHLKGIPNAALYDGKTSIYDLANSSFGGLVCLREHFRCVPEIIQFSNRLSYEGKIVPLRDESAVLLKPHVTSFRVSNASRSGDVNAEEAIAVVSLLVAASEEPEYAGKTFGVVSLLGEDQAIEIDRLLRKSLTPIEYEKRRIICGNPAQFQGDERDVMFLSMVDVPVDGPHPLRNDERFKKRFNVAASRAKDQMWVVYSLDPHVDLKADDLRRRIIEFGTNPRGYSKLIAEATEKAESEFEKQVFIRLTERKFSIVPQFSVGAYRIDMIVKGANGRKLAIECDGDRYHPIEKLPDDMARQALLERLGWKFIRIRGSEFFRNPTQAMDRVYARMNALGIEPGTGEQSLATESDRTGIVARVKARAAELRDSWAGDFGAPMQQAASAASAPATKRVSAEPRPCSVPSPPGDHANGFQLLSEMPNPVKPDAKMALRAAIEDLLQESFRTCAVCRSDTRLYIGKRGPYMECVKCKDRLFVPAVIVQNALKRMSAKCPECKGAMTAFDDGDGQGTTFRCEDRGHRMRAEFLVVP